MREPGVCGRDQEGPWSGPGDTVPGYAIGWALAIPMYGYPGGRWVVPRYTTLPVPTQPAPNPWYYPPTAPAVAIAVDVGSAVTASLDPAKEILGVNNAQCTGSGQYPRHPHCGRLLIDLAAGSL